MKRLLFMLLFAFAAWVVPGQMSGDDFRRRLAVSGGFTDEDFGVLAKGDAAVRVGSPVNKQDVSIVGAIRVGEDGSYTLEAFRQSLALRSNKSVAAGKIFSASPVAGDLDGLKLDDKDLAELRECRPGNCDFNLSADAIREIAAVFAVDGAGTREAAEDRIRSILLRYAEDYLGSGNRSLKPYANRPVKFDVLRAHQEILSEMLFLRELSPSLAAFFERFPEAPLTGAVSEIRWSAIDFGLNPAIVLTHSVAVTDSGNHFVVNKQFYGSRYLDASLSMSLLIRVIEGGRPVAYVVFADRTRTDALGGPLVSMARKIVVNDAVERSKALLERSKIQLLATGRSPADGAGPDAPDHSRIYLAIGAGAFILLLIWFLTRRRE